MSKYNLNENQAYMAMFYYLEDLFDNQGFDELGGLLGSMQLLEDGAPADPAAIKDWEKAVKRVVNQ